MMYGKIILLLALYFKDGFVYLWNLIIAVENLIWSLRKKQFWGLDKVKLSSFFLVIDILVPKSKDMKNKGQLTKLRGTDTQATGLDKPCT